MSEKHLPAQSNGEAIRLRVEAARAIQTERFKAHKNVTSNSAMPPRLVKHHCKIDTSSKALMEQAMKEIKGAVLW